MKTFLLIFTFALFGFIIAQTDITALDPISKTTLGSQSITLTVASGKIKAQDEIIFSKATAVANIKADDPKSIVETDVSGTSHSVTLEFKASGVYNVFIKRAGTTTQQTDQTYTITVAAPGNDIVSSISPTTGEKTKEIEITFTLKDKTSLLKYHRLVFSTAATPTATDLATQMTADVTTDTTKAKFTFPADGNYTLFVDNGSATKQGTIVLKISSRFLTMSFAAILCLLLF